MHISVDIGLTLLLICAVDILEGQKPSPTTSPLAKSPPTTTPNKISVTPRSLNGTFNGSTNVSKIATTRKPNSNTTVSPIPKTSAVNYIAGVNTKALNTTANSSKSSSNASNVTIPVTQPKLFQCVSTTPRLNLHLEKMLGEWYPVRLSQTTSTLWHQSFQITHNNSQFRHNDSCLLMEYNLLDSNGLTISLKTHNESTTVEAILLGDDTHPKKSKWAIAWPNGEDTLTSVVAVGSTKPTKDTYNWLLTVDCDLNGIVESDWAIMGRVNDRMSNATLNTILSIVEGLEGLTIDSAVSYKVEDCI